MKNLQYVIVTAGSYEKLADQINSLLAGECVSVRPCGQPFVVMEKDTPTWYQALFVVSPGKKG